MNRKLVFIFILSIFCLNLKGQRKTTYPRPKLVVGIVIDQMRWDFLYRYNDRYVQGGFNRLINQGFTCENTMIPYAPTVTAAGHTCIYTGSVPALHGIVGNEWYDKKNSKLVYCAEDSLVKAVGTSNKSNGKMSPKNMWTTSIADELRLSTNFEGKSVGVCIKDRGAIFPAGHSANAAYWYDASSGNWISSSYYMDKLPKWLKEINESRIVDKYYRKNWNTLYPIETYLESTADEQIYEGKFKGNPSSAFPYKLDTLVNKNFAIIPATPWGNSMSFDIAKAAIEEHKLGKGQVTDLLALSLSSPDYIGHQFGPNSIEIEDTYLRLDLDIESFLNHLDEKIGAGNYTVFLSADHGVAHIPGFLKKNNLPGEVLASSKYIIDINESVKDKYGIEDVIMTEQNYQLYLNHKAINSSGKIMTEVTDFILEEIKKYDAVAQTFLLKDLNVIPMNEMIRKYLNNGFSESRSGDIQVILKPGYFDGRMTGTTHGAVYAYDTHIPLLWYGWGIKKGKTNRTTYMTDIAATLAALLKIQMPNGCVGSVIEEAMK
jgi:predicted AlkP superfamily pyrophosphatase or phosphodiesterase